VEVHHEASGCKITYLPTLPCTGLFLPSQMVPYNKDPKHRGLPRMAEHDRSLEDNRRWSRNNRASSAILAVSIIRNDNAEPKELISLTLGDTVAPTTVEVSLTQETSRDACNMRLSGCSRNLDASSRSSGDARIISKVDPRHGKKPYLISDEWLPAWKQAAKTARNGRPIGRVRGGDPINFESSSLE
jgi:hypothetical protein